MPTAGTSLTTHSCCLTQEGNLIDWFLDQSGEGKGEGASQARYPHCAEPGGWGELN